MSLQHQSDAKQPRKHWLQLCHVHLQCTVDSSSTRSIFNIFSSSRHSKFVTNPDDSHVGLLLSNQCLCSINQMPSNLESTGYNSAMSIFSALLTVQVQGQFSTFSVLSSSRHSKFVTNPDDSHVGLLLSNQCLCSINQMPSNLESTGYNSAMSIFSALLTVQVQGQFSTFSVLSSSRHSKFVTNPDDSHVGLLLSNQCLCSINQMPSNLESTGYNSAMSIFSALLTVQVQGQFSTFSVLSSSRHSKFVTNPDDSHVGLLLSNQCLCSINPMPSNLESTGYNSAMSIFSAL